MTSSTSEEELQFESDIGRSGRRGSNRKTLASAEEEESSFVDDDEPSEAINALAKKPRLRFVLSPGTTEAVRKLMNTDKQGNVLGENASKDDSSVGDILEVCPEGMSLAQDMASRINKVRVFFPKDG